MDKEMSAALMADFSSEAIGHKPATWCKACANAVRNRSGKTCGDHKEIRCQKCKTKITEAHTCLDFVGHADVRARLCEVDPEWTWEPFEFPGTGSLILADGSPVGLWIHLTVGGVTKPGYGSCDKGKQEALKELIGDALRNAGLSFGIAWKLWAKGERTGSDGEDSGQRSAPDSFDNATPARPNGNGNGAPRGQVARPAAQPPTAVPDDAEPDQDAQQYADEAHGALTVSDVEAIHQRAREAGKISAFIKSPSSGKVGKLAVYIDWKRKQLKDVEAAWRELNDAAGKHRTNIADLENEFKIKTHVDMEAATAAQIREFIASLDKAAA